LPHFIANYLEPLSYFIYAVALLLRLRVDKRNKTKVLVVYYVLTCILMTYASWAITLPDNDLRRNNNWIYNLVFLLPNALLFCYFYLTLTSASKRFVTKGLLLLNVLVFSINDFMLHQFDQFNSFCNSFFSLSIVVCVLMYFHQVLANVSEKDILLEFDFWLISGYLLYFLGSFFIIVTYDYLSFSIKAPETLEQQIQLASLWGVGNILLFISALLTLIGTLWTRRQEKLR